MSQKSMIMNLILSGQVNSDFYKLGSEIANLGELIDQIGGKVRGFEKDSVETYKNYETFMLEAKGALTARYDSMSELERVMRSLDEHAQGWAASTIFDTRDVAQAISEAAHAGWTYEEMIEGIPQAMLLAQAGNISLAEGLDYVIKALNATGTEFEDGGTLIDQWVMAANSGATTVSQLGEAIIRMGGTSQFTDNTAEMFTMLAVLADIGTVGPDAGTALRNSMLRLIAPTIRASKMMDQLNVSSQEYYELASDEAALKNANELLEQTGFSAYDADGNLKPFLETYKDLYAAVSVMSEVDKNEVLAAIFPTRTLGYALGLLEAASRGYDNLYEKILGSNGYAQTVADIQTSGLMGTHEELESKWEEYSRKVGEILAPLETTGAQILGSFIDGLNNLDEVSLAGLVGAMNAIALAGPAAGTIGGALKLFSALGPKLTFLVTLTAAAGAAAGTLSKLAEIDLASTFGTLELDVEKIGGYVDQIETKFDIENSKVSQYATALETANTNYLTLTATLEEDLLTASLTGKTLTDEEIANITKLGNDIGANVLEGIRAARGESLSFLEAIFGDAEEGSDEAKALEDAVDWTNGRFGDLYAQAQNIGAQLRASMVSALADGTLNEADQAAIDASIARLNQIQAEIASRMNRQDFLAQLKKAQSISWDSLETYLADNVQKQKDDLAAAQELYYSQWGQMRESWEHEYAKATTDAQRAELEAEWTNLEAQLEKEQKATEDSIKEKYGELSYAAFNAAMSQSENGQAWKFLNDVWNNETASHDMHGWNFGGADLSKYLPAGVTAEEMEKQLFDLWRGEHGWLGSGNKYSGVMEPYDDGNISQILDSAYDVTVKPAVDTGELDAVIGEQSEHNLTAMVDGDTADLEASIDDQDERELTAYVNGNVSALVAAINSVDGMEISVGINARGLSGLRGGSSGSGSPGGGSSSSPATFGPVYRGYADGGRATEASIFGEAGPEWAIPEEHSSRTADLLNLARQASGFTWGDLISRYGGLNGTAGGKGITLTYAPTIHASNADGVERVLAGDKERLMAMMRTMMEEAKMRDDAEVYA